MHKNNCINNIYQYLEKKKTGPIALLNSNKKPITI